MGLHCSPGDKVVCKIKDNKIVNIYEETGCEKKVFEIISIHNNGYMVYIPNHYFLHGSVYLSPDNLRRYKIDKRFADTYTCYITEHNITAIHSKLDGMRCCECDEFYPMAAANFEETKLLCWRCRHYPIYR